MKLLPILAVAATVGLGVAGYSIAGSPGLQSSPAQQSFNDARFTPEAEKASQLLLENFGDVRAWLTLSDALIRSGRTELAVLALNDAIRAIPGDVNLWVQLGVALVAHSKGEVVPAARLAFDRASRLDPSHPAPGYFLGLAFLQAGQPARALTVWEGLAQSSPTDAQWRPMLDRQIRAARMMIALGVGAPAAAAPSSDE